MPPMAAPWRVKVLKSLARNKRLVNSRYVQLATVKPDGRPSNRTVVFRGFLGDTDDLTFVTDSRSNKIRELAANPAAEVCWYFPDSREQYRISGHLTIVDAHHIDERLLAARQLAWSKMSDGGRTQFAWPHPGLVRENTPPEAFKQPAPGAEEPPLTTFCLAVLQPDQVDHLLLFSNERSVYRRQVLVSGAPAWAEEDVNP